MMTSILIICLHRPAGWQLSLLQKIGYLVPMLDYSYAEMVIISPTQNIDVALMPHRYYQPFLFPNLRIVSLHQTCNEGLIANQMSQESRISSFELITSSANLTSILPRLQTMTETVNSGKTSMACSSNHSNSTTRAREVMEPPDNGKTGSKPRILPEHHIRVGVKWYFMPLTMPKLAVFFSRCRNNVSYLLILKINYRYLATPGTIVVNGLSC